MPRLPAHNVYPGARAKVSHQTLRLVLFLTLGATSVLGAQEPQDTLEARPQVRLTLPGVDRLVVRTPRTLLPGGRLAPRTPSSLVTALWLQQTLDSVARRREARRAARLRIALGLEAAPTPQDTIVRPRIAMPRPEDVAEPERPAVFRAVGAYADLGLDVRARLEMKFDRLRNARCTVAQISDPASGCQGGFPTPSFGEQFRVRAGGIVSQRVHVNVDFDSEREFSANNTINVYYQGLEDEILRRVDIGNVDFRAPASRFITAAVPANSFGVQAEAQLGPVQFRTIIAQQKGSAVRTRTFTVGEATTQPVDVEQRDLDFESGRFFFVVNPQGLPGYPAVDVLSLNPQALPPGQRPVSVRVYRLRAQGGQVGSNLNLGGIDAVALRSDSPQRVGPFSWELLVEGQDYYIDQSGTWFALASRVGTEEFLAVSYITATGDTVGTFPAVNGTLDTLELIHEPRRGPDVPTYYYEMRNVYRIGGTDLDRNSVDLVLRVGNSETPLNQQGTYLSLLGLAEVSDPSALDQSNRVFPRLQDAGADQAVRGLYVVFPHLQPFADSTRLQGAERADSLYRTPTYLLATQGPAPRFALHFHYEATGSGDRSNLSLGSIQVRAGSERIYVGNRQLVRGQDYEVDYGLGQVTFLDPGSLFSSASTAVRVEFEENQLFDDAPKTLFGVSSTYDLGAVGSVSAMGIFQRERTISTRPTLGFEPEAAFIGGLSTDLTFRSEGLTRALDALPLLRASVPSALTVNGEVALSLPNANQAGAAYIEDFDGESGFKIPLTDRLFQLGSAPSSGVGLPVSHLGPGGGFSDDDAVPLVWQNLVQSSDGGALQFGPQEIDSTIALAGTGVNIETVLWLTMKPDTVGGLPDAQTGVPRWIRPHTPGPRWRSVTQPLGGGSGVGVDLSRTEFLEFWVLENALQSATNANAYLVFDFGEVFEDAVAFAPQTIQVAGQDTTFTGFRLVGSGRLDTEKDSLTNVFNAQVQDVGILGDRPDSIVDGSSGDVLTDVPLCDVRGLSGLVSFPLGDLAARCTRGNGYLDTEDLDGDNRLDVNVGRSEENFVRYVFPVGDSRYFVRNGVTHYDGQGRPLTWRLYRIPFRQDTVVVGRPNLRQVQAMRITMVVPDQGPEEEELWLAMARMRLVGAPWLKRASTPIPGLSGDRGALHGEVVASIVTTENTDLGYTTPPGIINAPDRADAGLGIGSVQINEKSLRVLATDLRENERAEAFIRFTNEADKNFLKYRTLRVWARGRGPGWQEHDLEFYIKVGRDENNFYLYRTPVRTDTWEPEITVDMNRWLELRAQVESTWLSGAPPSGAGACGGDSTAYVACAGPYVVHIRDPATAPPNLARVSEVAVGILRTQETTLIGEAEVWVDDIRLSGVVDDAGLAGAVDVGLAASDFAQVNFAMSRQNPTFRQIGQDPTYLANSQTSVTSIVGVDKLLPEALGVTVPLTIRHTRTGQNPYYVDRTDVRADQLANLRKPEASGTVVDVTVARSARSTGFVGKTFVDPVRVQAHYERLKATTSLSQTRSRNRQLRLQYILGSIGARTIPALPGFLRSAVELLPDWISNSEFGRGLRTSRFRWNPFQIRLQSTFTDNVSQRYTYRVPVALASDADLRRQPGIVHTWHNEAGLDLRPFSSFTLTANYASTRDLQTYGDSTTVGRLLESERRRFLGSDVGFERLRVLSTAINLAPPFSGWLRPRFVFSSNFTFSRNPNRQDVVRVGADSSGAFRLPETISNSRTRDIGATIDLGRLGTGIAGDSGLVASLFRAIFPSSVSYIVERRSGFDRPRFELDARYQLALGGLDDFLRQDGQLATSASEIRTVTATGGTRLPLGAQARFSYRDLHNRGWQGRGDEQVLLDQRNREWPSVTLTVGYTPPEFLRRVLTHITGQAQYRVQETSSEQPSFVGGETGGASVRTESRARLVAPSLTLGWIGGITTTAQFSKGRSDAVTAGNVTQSERTDWSGSASFAFRPPRSLVNIRNRIVTTVLYDYSRQAVCLVRAGSGECRSISDSRRNQLDMRMDTGFTQTLRGGLTVSYVTSDQRHTSTKLTQLVVTLFGEINLQAGRLQ